MGVKKDKLDAIKKQMSEILDSVYGNVTLACKKAKVSKTTFYKWYNEDEEFRDSCVEVKDTALDFVESQLMSNIAKGDTTSIIFYLKTQGKKRGYNPDSNVNVGNKNGETFKVDLELTKEQKDAMLFCLERAKKKQEADVTGI